MSIVFLRLSSVAKSKSLQRRLISSLLMALFGLMILFSLSSSFVSYNLSLFSLDLSLPSLSCCLVLIDSKHSYIVSRGSILLSFCILLLALISVHSSFSVMANLKLLRSWASSSCSLTGRGGRDSVQPIWTDDILRFWLI